MKYEIVLTLEDGGEIATAEPSETDGEPGEIQTEEESTEIQLLKDIKITNTAIVILLALTIFYTWIRGFFKT